MQDSLKWIETLNPDKNEREMGFNYYGISVIDKKSATKLLKLINAWFLLFSEAPEEFTLTGWYTWTEDNDPKATGYYEKLLFNREETLEILGKLLEFVTKVEAEEYKIIYCGI